MPSLLLNHGCSRGYGKKPAAGWIEKFNPNKKCVSHTPRVIRVDGQLVVTRRGGKSWRPSGRQPGRQLSPRDIWTYGENASWRPTGRHQAGQKLAATWPAAGWMKQEIRCAGLRCVARWVSGFVRNPFLASRECERPEVWGRLRSLTLPARH